ncbi:hypothetical protein PPERSA_04634 [Pseudocohnilembus persalinus]|uniref:Peptidase M3A/M3B catalytic domain-containing protein n=1 Tax=Pseudocohnilembus persalinus TaxID=266149 RepID=A0A0V0QNE4_PSEPJ|nr:hypothetical protein PPERSA_04634 [Pseudocohnilembus persalinus]|eukprot:KRX03839.1 hypothetical protein PPERSA_04634 [Pseudocohnilembus persalinus]
MTVEGFDFDFKNLNIEVLKKYKEEIYKEIKECLDEIANFKGERTFENTARPSIEMSCATQNRINCFSYVENFFVDAEARKFASEANAEISQFLIEQNQRKDVYKAFLDYEQNGFQKEKNELTYEERRFVVKTMRDFRRDGLHLDDEELVKYQKELSDVCIKANSNINEENTKFEFTRQQLDGLPDSWFTEKRLKKKHESDQKQDIYEFTLKYPDFYPGMEYIKDSELRKKIQHAYNSRCAKENVPLIERAFVLRYLIAKKLGYDTHADFKCEVKIVKNGKNALEFEKGLNEKFEPLYQQDMKDLLEFAQNYEQNPLKKDSLDPWDINYYKRAYKEVKCDLDMEKVKEYFPLPTVTQGLFNIYQTLLGLVFTEIDTDNKWHDQVRFFRVNDAKTNEIIGYFYFDLYPREGKYSHAACFDFQDACDTTKFKNEKLKAQKKMKNVCTIACNFEESGCISFSDVETFFHEFGHVMHCICSNTQLQDFAGLRVETDFVEAPSQMLEFWCYQQDSLTLMSAHKETGETIPAEMVQKLKKQEKLLQGYFNKRQLMFGMFDLKVHTMDLKDGKIDSRKIWYENEEEVMHFSNSNQADPAAGFMHLMGGYDAGYYGYLRAETYAANMFYKIFENGKILDPEAGMRYRQKILAPGSSKDGLELLEDFLGEKPDDSYFLIAKGLQK